MVEACTGAGTVRATECVNGCLLAHLQTELHSLFELLLAS